MNCGRGKSKCQNLPFQRRYLESLRPLKKTHDTKLHWQKFANGCVCLFSEAQNDEAEETHSLSENKYMPLDAERFDETKLEQQGDLNDQDEKYPENEESRATARKRRADIMIMCYNFA